MTMQTRCWLGWVLLIAGALNALLWTFIVVVIALFANEPWGDEAGMMFGLWLLGVLAAIASIRILRGTSRRGIADTA
jgi:hypothetical protein